MNCPKCGVPAPSITLGSGEDAMTMVTCARCRARAWQCRGEDIDLRDVLVRAGRSSGAGDPSVADEILAPVGMASATEMLRSGLSARHVVAGLVSELGLDERAAWTALRAAERAAPSLV